MPNPIIPTPSDVTAVEKKIINYAYANIYSLIPDPVDKFIVAFMFDMGNSPSITSVAIGLSRTSLFRRTKRIKYLLRNVKLDGSMFNE